MLKYKLLSVPVAILLMAIPIGIGLLAQGAAYETGFHTHVMKPNSKGSGSGGAREIVDYSNPKKA